jgi:hypothetical protein
MYASNGLIANTAKRIKAVPESITQREIKGDVSSPDKAIARARSIQAATSLTAAADIAMRPTSVVRSLSSARIRARTGNAVIERATPMKTRKGTGSAPLEIVALRTTDVPMPRTNGTVIPQRAIAKAFLPVLWIDRMSSSRPTRNKKNKRPMLASVSRTVKLLFGKIVFRNFSLRPIAEGPKSIPPCNAMHIFTKTIIKNMNKSTKNKN